MQREISRRMTGLGYHALVRRLFELPASYRRKPQSSSHSLFQPFVFFASHRMVWFDLGCANHFGVRFRATPHETYVC